MPGPHGTTEKPNDMRRAFKRFYEEIKPWRKQLIFMVVLSIIANVVSLFGPILLGKMTTSATTSLAAGKGINWDEIGGTAVFIIVLFIISAILSYVQSVVMARISAQFAKTLRGKTIEKISRLPIAFFDQHQTGDVISRMINDSETVASSLAETINQIVTSVVTVVGILIMMVFISVPLSVIALISIPLSLFSSAKIMEKAQKHFRLQRKYLGDLNSTIEEDYTGQNVIKINSHETKSYADFSVKNDALYTASWKSQFLGSLAFPITHMFTHASYVLICVAGGYLAIAGRITIGNVQAFIQYVNRFNRPITEVAQIGATIQQVMAAAERVFDFLDEEEMVPDRKDAHDILPDEVNGEVEFHNVSFAYQVDKPVITNFSAKIKPGMKVAIVGPTGAGKTTIVNLLMRFYDPQSGYITIDGVPTSEMKRSAVRSLFGMVLQDTWLFSGTVYDNLKYGASGSKPASDSDIKRAVKATGLTHFIDSLPNGYKTTISEDSDNVSAGEKQLLTIARAMVANPPMMILDEATSNVDTRTEQLIQKAFDKLTDGRTSFVIAHRLSTVRNSDLILVMRDGNIVEQGKHDDLLKLNGFYAELYNSQFSEKR